MPGLDPSSMFAPRSLDELRRALPDLQESAFFHAKSDLPSPGRSRELLQPFLEIARQGLGRDVFALRST